MKEHPLPATLPEWLDDIVFAMSKARDARPPGALVDQKLAEADLFHLAPLICSTFRRSRVYLGCEHLREQVLMDFFAHFDPDDYEVEHQAFMEFAYCFLSSHVVFQLIDVARLKEILDFCEERLFNGFLDAMSRDDRLILKPDEWLVVTSTEVPVTSPTSWQSALAYLGAIRNDTGLKVLHNEVGIAFPAATALALPGVPCELSVPKCEVCMIPMILRFPRTGPFWGCSRFPDCKFTKTVLETVRLEG